MSLNGGGLVFDPCVVTDKDGNKVPAKLTRCSHCSGNVFVVFTVEGQDHPHVQCSRCSTTYCYGGRCDAG